MWCSNLAYIGHQLFLIIGWLKLLHHRKFYIWIHFNNYYKLYTLFNVAFHNNLNSTDHWAIPIPHHFIYFVILIWLNVGSDQTFQTPWLFYVNVKVMTVYLKQTLITSLMRACSSSTLPAKYRQVVPINCKNINIHFYY